MMPSSPSRTRTEPFSYSPLMTAWTGKFSRISLALAGDRTGHDDARFRHHLLDREDDLAVVLPTRRRRLDEDVAVVRFTEMVEVGRIAFAQRQTVAHHHLGAGRPRRVGGGIPHEERVGQVAAEDEVVRGRMGMDRVRPARSRTDAGQAHVMRSPIVVDRELLEPPGRVAEQNFHGASPPAASRRSAGPPEA